MSHQASAYVKGLLRHEVNVRQKLLLMVLADYHSTETRLAYPSLRRLAEESLVDERKARRLLNELEGKFIERTPGQGRGNNSAYRFIALDEEIPGYVAPLFRAKKGVEKRAEKGAQKGAQNGVETASAIRKEQELKPEQEQTLPLIAEDDSPEPVEKRGSTQHALVRERIQKLYNAANPETPCPWDGRTGKILNDTLDRLRWPDAALLTAVDNRFASDVVLSEDPLRWIPHLDQYRAGPLDRFNKPEGRKQNANDRLKNRLQRELEISAQLDRKQTG
jgi:hypothetical protein